MALKANIGRPPMSDSEKRTLPVEMRLNKEEKQKLLLAAKISGMPLATWMRSSLLAAATHLLGMKRNENANSSACPGGATDMIERRKFLAGLAAAPLLPLKMATTPRAVPEYEKWYFSIAEQSWLNVCLDLKLTKRRVYELQIRFSGPRSLPEDPQDPYVTIESVGKGPVFMPYTCKKCHAGMDKEYDAWCGRGYCHECASKMWKAKLEHEGTWENSKEVFYLERSNARWIRLMELAR